MKKKSLINIFILLISTFNLAAYPWDADLEIAWKTMRDAEINESASDEIIFAAGQNIQMETFPDDASIAAVRLWAAGEENRLVLAWLEQKNRAIRVIILSLIICESSDLRSQREHRFKSLISLLNDDEKQKRTEELKIVLLHKKQFATKWINVLSGRKTLNIKRVIPFQLTVKEP